MVALLEGRPVVQHVLDTLAVVRAVPTVVVLGPGRLALDGISWGGAQLVTNPHPERGLAGSIRIGLQTCWNDPSVAGACILLGDQPRTAASTLLALASSVPDAIEEGSMAVLPDYVDGGGMNPVLLLRAGAALVAELSGDQGLGAVLAGRQIPVRRVRVPGSNPDIDTPDDLAAMERGQLGGG